MSLLGRMKRAISAKANAALETTDPKKALDQMIREMDESILAAKKELLGFKATEKRLNREIEALDDKIADWDKRARLAVQKGDDDLAKEALREKQNCESKRAGLVRDKNEAASYAIEINKGRKQVETKLQILKLKRGTLAQQLATARSGETGFGGDEIWERMQQAEERIDAQVAESEVDEMLGLGDAESRVALDALEKQTRQDAQDDALAALKAKMGAKQLPAGEDSEKS